MIALFLAGCRAAPTPPPVAGPAPPPLDWGSLTVQASGQQDVAATVPVLCGDDGGLVFRAHAPAETPWWSVALDRRPLGDPPQAVPRLSLLLAEDRAALPEIWTSGPVDPGTDAGGRWSAVLEQPRPNGTVQLDVTVRCGDVPRVPDALVEVLADVAQAEVRRYATADHGKARVEGPLSALVPRERGFALVQALRKRLPPGYLAYQGTSRMDADPRVELVLAVGATSEDLIRTANVDPVDANLDAVDVARRVATWEARFQAVVMQADAESVTALVPESADSGEVAREAAAFCPAVIEQAGSVREYEFEIERNHQLYCWWP